MTLCKRCQANLALYFYGELGVLGEIMVREHLDSCDYCRAKYEELTKGLQAVIFVLKEHDGMEIETIADLFGISPAAVKSHLVRAVETLKRVVHQSGNFMEASCMPDKEDEG